MSGVVIGIIIGAIFAAFGALVDRDPFGDNDSSTWTQP